MSKFVRKNESSFFLDEGKSIAFILMLLFQGALSYWWHFRKTNENDFLAFVFCKNTKDVVSFHTLYFFFLRWIYFSISYWVFYKRKFTFVSYSNVSLCNSNAGPYIMLPRKAPFWHCRTNILPSLCCVFDFLFCQWCCLVLLFGLFLYLNLTLNCFSLLDGELLPKAGSITWSCYLPFFYNETPFNTLLVAQIQSRPVFLPCKTDSWPFFCLDSLILCFWLPNCLAVILPLSSLDPFIHCLWSVSLPCITVIWPFVMRKPTYTLFKIDYRCQNLFLCLVKQFLQLFHP